jgi:catechol 2,3-dioxygenase-like lactoylglutathione lyase family enzyme
LTGTAKSIKNAVSYLLEGMNMKLELIAVPVSDVDRAKEFYTKVGFTVDHDRRVSETLRFVQLTPPGSACSICIGEGLTGVAPGTLDFIVLVVPNAQQAHDDLKQRSIDVTEPQTFDWGTFVYFDDPDGNKWSLQELPKK